MTRKKKVSNRVDELLDELIGDNPQLEDILGESGLLKQLSKRLVKRALVGELTHHLQQPPAVDSEAEVASGPRNSRNGCSKKTVQSEQGEMKPSIPCDRCGEFEPILVPKDQRSIAWTR